MSLFWKRERQVRQLLGDYFSVCDRALDAFGEALSGYLETNDREAFAEYDRRIHALESRADDLRVEVEKLLYSRALLPESRGDLLRVLEAFDRIPNLAETVTFMIATQGIEVPAAFCRQLKDYLDMNLAAYRHLRHTIDCLLSHPDQVEETVGAVDADESASDRLERTLITGVFSAEMDKADKLHLRELIGRIGDISDHAERVARRIEIVALKRRI